MDKTEITYSQDKDPDYNFNSSLRSQCIYMDKLSPESAENAISVGKPKLSDPSISAPEETEVSVQVLGVKPGAEMLSAMEEAKTIGANVALIDRDIQVTLQRFWGKMKFLEKLRMIGSLLGGLIEIGKGNDIDIDQITEPDFVAELVSELRGFAPTAAKVLILSLIHISEP